jgi:hypothetical protein
VDTVDEELLPCPDKEKQEALIATSAPASELLTDMEDSIASTGAVIIPSLINDKTAEEEQSVSTANSWLDSNDATD